MCGTGELADLQPASECGTVDFVWVVRLAVVEPQDFCDHCNAPFARRRATPLGQMHQFNLPTFSPVGLKTAVVSMTPELPQSVQTSLQ
jgi:hypothetical protein